MSLREQNEPLLPLVEAVCDQVGLLRSDHSDVCLLVRRPTANWPACCGGGCVPCVDEHRFGAKRVLEVQRRAQRLLASHEHFFGEPLCDAEALFTSPWAVVSHGVEEDPIFWYGNRTALELFELEWKTFVAMPSRLSAQPDLQQERELMLGEVARDGCSERYAGVRVSAGGRRFRIEDARVWNVLEADGSPIGQAAAFRSWSFLERALAAE